MLNIFKTKIVKNASWMVGVRIFQMILSFFVGLYVARYLGPANYGTLNYTLSLIALFSAVSTLGFNNILVKELIDRPEKQGEVIGTSIVLRLFSSLFSIVSVILVAYLFNPDDKIIIVMTAVQSLALLFQGLETISYWYQSRLQSKVPSIIHAIAYTVVSIVKLVFCLTQRALLWFAFSNLIDVFVVGCLLLIAYKKSKGLKLTFSWTHGKRMLKMSWFYIVSGVMITLYNQTDKIMLKALLDETTVGYYSVAYTLSTIWVFVLVAIIDSMRPVIIEMHAKSDFISYEKNNRRLYTIVFWLSIFVAIVFALLADFIVKILYGEAYVPAASAFRILVFSIPFSYLGVAKDIWLLCENKQKYIILLSAGGAAINIALNYLLIPTFQASGAALATVITQIFVNIFLLLLIKPLRKNGKLILQGICFIGIRNRSPDADHNHDDENKIAQEACDKSDGDEE